MVGPEGYSGSRSYSLIHHIAKGIFFSFPHLSSSPCGFSLLPANSSSCSYTMCEAISPTFLPLPIFQYYIADVLCNKPLNIPRHRNSSVDNQGSLHQRQTGLHALFFFNTQLKILCSWTQEFQNSTCPFANIQASSIKLHSYHISELGPNPTEFSARCMIIPPVLRVIKVTEGLYKCAASAECSVSQCWASVPGRTTDGAANGKCYCWPVVRLPMAGEG